MEHRSKRRRVGGRKSDGPVVDDTSRDKPENEIDISIAEGQATSHGVPKLVLPSSGDTALHVSGASHQVSEPPLEPIDPSRLPVPRLELRQLVPNVVSGVAGTVTGAAGAVLAPIPSVLDGVVNNGEEAATNAGQPAVTDTVLPPSSTSPGSVQPPAGVAAQDARESALAQEQDEAKEDDRLPPPPSVSPPQAESSSPTNPMSIELPGSSSQKVLGSPPTPLPSSPNPSGGHSGSSSYFSSSPAATSLSPSSSVSPPAASATRASLAPSSNTNSTMSSTMITSSVTSTSTGTVTASNSIEALLASLSASRASVSSLEAKSTSFAGSSITGTNSPSSTPSPTTMVIMTSSSQISSQSASASGSLGAGAGGVGGVSNTAGAPSPTSTSGSGSGGGSSMPATPVLVGGIVGGIAGLVLILLAALLLIRSRKGRLSGERLGEGRNISPPMLQTSGPGDAPQSGSGTTGTMTQRSSTAPIAAAGFFGRLRPSSSQTAETTDTAPSERGFQKISGRKLPSVLTSGGDGYGNAAAAGGTAAAGGAAAGAGAGSSRDGPRNPQNRGVAPGQGPFAGLAPGLRPSPPHSLSGSSFYRDSRGFYGGVVPESSSGATEPGSGSPTSSSPTFPSPLALAGGLAATQGSPSRNPTMRPGPARTPVINEPGIIPGQSPSGPRGPPPRPVRATPPPGGEYPTGGPPHPTLGRSHPSEDGSRASRFVESTTPP